MGEGILQTDTQTAVESRGPAIIFSGLLQSVEGL